MTRKYPTCPTCGIELDGHPSQAELCRKLEAARSTLQVISTWATFQGGIELVPEHVARLIGDTLRKIG